MEEKIISNLSLGQLLDSIRSENVFFEITGVLAFFGYKDGKFNLFEDSKLTRVLKQKDKNFKPYLRTLHVMLFCLKMRTVNPKNFWLKLKLHQENMQILEIGVIKESSISKSKALKYFDSIPDFSYGCINVFKNPSMFRESQFSKEIVAHLDLELNKKILEIDKAVREDIFLKIKQNIINNSYSKFSFWDTNQSKTIRIRTKYGELKIFRNRDERLHKPLENSSYDSRR